MVGRLTQIINPGTAEAKYIVSFKHFGKYVVGLDKDLAPTDVEEGMRVGCEDPHSIGTKISVKLPLPPRIDPTVTMM
jgi:26S proteasome regulatory subunit T1